MIGGIVFGHLSDRYGRIRMLTVTILVFSIFTGLCAVAQGYWDLLAWRTLAGVGLGGEFGIGMALIAEAWPAEKRNRASAWVGIGWQLGVLMAAFITPPLLSMIGWRGMFLVGLLPALVSFVIRCAAWENRRRIATGQKRAVTLVSGTPESCWSAIAPPQKPAYEHFILLTSVRNFGYYGRN